MTDPLATLFPPVPEDDEIERAGSRALSYRQVRALSTDPVRLERQLDGNTAMMLDQIGGLLVGAPLAPGQRSALFRVAASLPGVELAHDALDRRRDAVSLTAGWDAGRLTATLVFDPATGAVLGTRTVVKDTRGRVTGDYGAVYETEVRNSTRA